MYEDLTIGVLITDEKNRIINYNTSAINLLGKDTLKGELIDHLMMSFSDTISIELIRLEDHSLMPNKIYHIRTKADNDREFFKKIVENCYDEIFVSDTDTACLYVNPTFERHYNVDRKEVINNRNFMISNALIDNSPVYATLETKRPTTIEIETSTGKTLLISTKPVFKTNGEIDFVVGTSRDISELRNAQEEVAFSLSLVEKYEDEISLVKNHSPEFDNSLIYSSKIMNRLMEIINRIAKVDSTVLITGESGTGKTAIAKRIHNRSNRSKQPFITIDCTAIPENLIESELFGYAPGAFTGALKKGKEGLISAADGGTLFLDEIGELPLKTQAKLLLFLQSHEFTPVGETKTKKVDVRIVAATNQNLVERVEQRGFRKDLYYRLNVVELQVPPLRERTEDMIPLISYFLKFYDRKYNFDHVLSQKATHVLINYSWPGNIRELQNLIESLVVTTVEHIIEQHHFPDHFLKDQMDTLLNSGDYPISFEASVKNFEEIVFTKAYHQFDSTYKIAKALNITQSKVMRLIKKHIKQNESEST